MTATFPSSVWLRQRSILSVSGATTGSSLNVYVYQNAVPLVAQLSMVYTTDASGNLQADLSDAMRIMQARGFANGIVEVGTYSIGNPLNTKKTFSIDGLQNLAMMAKPKSIGWGDVLEYDEEMYLTPPARILGGVTPINLLFATNDVESYAAGFAVQYYGVDAIWYNAGTLFNISQIPSNARAVKVLDPNDGNALVAMVKFDLPCYDTASVQWQGRDGSVRKFGWLVKKRGTEVDSQTEYDTIANEWKVSKGTKEVATLFMDNMSAYDYWFYSDIIASDSVTVDGVKANVITNKVEQPDGADWNTLEIEVELQRYDEI